MTIEQLLDLPAYGLEAIPDDQLVKMLEPYFKFTRPDTSKGTGMLLPKTGVSSKMKSAAVKQEQGMKAVLKNLDFGTLTDEKMMALRKMMHGK
jgi:hypothetical protein